jgi:hypothetical protein
MKIKLIAILITLGIIIWLTIIFFIYTSKYSSEAKRFSFYSTKNYEEPDDYFRNVKSMLTLILLKDDMVFGYYGDSINNGKVVSINETNKLIQDARKIFSKDSLIVFIKLTGEANLNAGGDMLDKMSANQVENYTAIQLNKTEVEFLKLTNRIKAGKRKTVY